MRACTSTRSFPARAPARSRPTSSSSLLIALFAWSGMKVHDTVTDLNSISRGVQDAGTSVQDRLQRTSPAPCRRRSRSSAARCSDSLGTAGQATGGNVVARGTQGETAVNDTATRARLGDVRAADARAARVLHPAARAADPRAHGGPPRAATRSSGPSAAACSRCARRSGCRGSTCSRITTDPIGDLEAGRLDPLLAALYADAGLRAAAGRGRHGARVSRGGAAQNDLLYSGASPFAGWCNRQHTCLWSRDSRFES